MSATIFIALSLLLPMALIAVALVQAFRDENYIARRTHR
jgi:hypothetical protein